MEVLDAGQTATYGSLGAAMLTCRSLRNGGVYCYDQGSGRGFEFGPTGYRFDDAFLGQVAHRVTCV